MNGNLEEGLQLADEICNRLPSIPTGQSVIFCSPFIHLSQLVERTNGLDRVHVGAQNCAKWESGAFTGETSASMIKSCGADYVIIGHSERREYFEESGETLARKTDLVLQYELTPIFCCGEKLEIREAGKHFDLVEKQVSEGLFHLKESEFSKIVIAYEPVWAIGTGVVASSEQAQEMHQFIRAKIAQQYSDTTADQITILYGGSVKPGNARELFSQPDVDGGLVGGASLKSADFIEIIKAL